MKKLLQAYNSYSRTERMGIIALLVLCILLVVFRATMHLWVKSGFDKAEEAKLVAAWNAHKQQNTSAPPQENSNGQVITNIATAELPPAQLFPFDPNVLDSAGFIKLGLRPKTVSILLHWRARGKHFYSKEDFKPLYTLTSAEYERLAPYITIKAPEQKRIDLNTADSAELVALNGIGAKLAHRILEYRNIIGRFNSVEQLRDVYRFPDSTIEKLKKQLVVK